MSQRPQRLHSVRESRAMSSSAAGSWRQFHMLPSGGSCAKQVQDELSLRLTSRGRYRVSDSTVCDFYLAFCPISSRVGTDISDAERSLPGDKPVVLVVLHHTFNPEYTFRPSKHLVDKANVVLTVDMLFHQGALLRCPHNDQAWASVEEVLKGAEPGLNVWEFLRKHSMLIFAGVAMGTVVIGLYVLVMILRSI